MSASIPETTIGIDLGDKYSQFCVLSKGGDVVEEGRVVTSKSAFRRKFFGVEPSRIAIEVGTHSRWIQELLEAAGHEVLVANPRKLRMIFQNESKHDRLDAMQLARVVRMDPQLLYPIRHRGGQAQADLSVIRSRSAVVAMRTRLVNHVRGVLKSHGVRPGKCSTRCFARRMVEVIPEALKPALLPVLEVLSSLNVKIDQYNRAIKCLINEQYREATVVGQVKGVGPITSLSYVLTLEDPRRFTRSRRVGAYLGLRPRRRQSGGRDPELRITKTGDADLRRLLVTSAQYILGPFGPDSDLRRFGLKLAERGRKNAKKRAVVAVARKLAVLLHRLWITGEVYEPLRQANAQRQTA